jgi:hypothetical protein
MPDMPPLPKLRVSESTPFFRTGLDYLGPLFIKPESEDNVHTNCEDDEYTKYDDYKNDVSTNCENDVNSNMNADSENENLDIKSTNDSDEHTDNDVSLNGEVSGNDCVSNDDVNSNNDDVILISDNETNIDESALETTHDIRRITLYHCLTWRTVYTYRGNKIIHEEEYVTGDRWIK